MCAGPGGHAGRWICNTQIVQAVNQCWALFNACTSTAPQAPPTRAQSGSKSGQTCCFVRRSSTHITQNIPWTDSVFVNCCGACELLGTGPPSKKTADQGQTGMSHYLLATLLGISAAPPAHHHQTAINCVLDHLQNCRISWLWLRIYSDAVSNNTIPLAVGCRPHTLWKWRHTLVKQGRKSVSRC